MTDPNRTTYTTKYGTVYHRIGKAWQRKRRMERGFKNIIPEVVPLHVLRKVACQTTKTAAVEVCE